jgi:hypothetical protein
MTSARQDSWPDVQLTPHFKLSEFRCHCCGQANAGNALLLAEHLEPVRADIGPIIIDDSFRCQAHNEAVGGKADSLHLVGLAADISATDDEYRYKLLKSLLIHGFLRIGIQVDDIHTDLGQTTTPIAWTELS